MPINNSKAADYCTEFEDYLDKQSEENSAISAEKDLPLFLDGVRARIVREFLSQRDLNKAIKELSIPWAKSDPNATRPVFAPVPKEWDVSALSDALKLCRLANGFLECYCPDAAHEGSLRIHWQFIEHGITKDSEPSPAGASLVKTAIDAANMSRVYAAEPHFDNRIGNGGEKNCADSVATDMRLAWGIHYSQPKPEHSTALDHVIVSFPLRSIQARNVAMQPGDVLVFDSSDNHIMIYVGNGQVKSHDGSHFPNTQILKLSSLLELINSTKTKSHFRFLHSVVVYRQVKC